MTQKTARGADDDAKLALQVQLEALKVKRLTLQQERDKQKATEREAKRRQEAMQHQSYYNRNWWNQHSRREPRYPSPRDEAEYYPGEVSCSMRDDGCN